MQARYGTGTDPSNTSPQASTKSPSDQGFTLIELLVVIAILGLLVTLVAPRVLNVLGGAKVSIARDSIDRLESILDMYKLDVGAYPSTEDGLQALLARPSDADNWNGPYVKSSASLDDPWNHPFVYRDPSQREGLDYDLCSLGPGNPPDPSREICNK